MRFYSRLFIAMSCALLMLNASFAEPQNLGILKKELRHYHDSGAYEQELAAVIGKAQRYILSRAKQNQLSLVKKKLAIVLDIDETSLSNYDKFVKRDFVASPAQLRQDVLAANSPAIKPMLVLYKNALRNNVSVFFVTGRPLKDLASTKTNLLRDGYRNWSGLYLRPDDYNRSSIIPFKAHTRALISKQGYTIIATIGDQYSDLLGGYAQREFKLPNPWYFLP